MCVVEIPSPNLQTSEKHQSASFKAIARNAIPELRLRNNHYQWNSIRGRSREVDVWNFSGAWSLRFGAFPLGIPD
jgi:hypothetical protein